MDVTHFPYAVLIRIREEGWVVPLNITPLSTDSGSDISDLSVMTKVLKQFRLIVAIIGNTSLSDSKELLECDFYETIIIFTELLKRQKCKKKPFKNL